MAAASRTISKTLFFFLLLVVSTAISAITTDDIRKLYLEIDQSSEKKTTLNMDDLSFLFTTAANHKVASLDYLYKYDPSGKIGFCFGRAMAVDRIARRMGIPKQNLGKLFIVGDMRSGSEPEWRFHVTTVVKGPQGKWFAIDPIMKGPMTIEGWVQYVQNVWDKRKKAKFYLTPTSAVLPDLRTVPDAPNEKGKYLIEISFDPSGKPGFTATKIGTTTAYTVSTQASQAYFSDVYTAEPKDRFNFLDITIDGEEFFYKHYFVELIQDLHDAPDKDFETTKSFSQLRMAETLRKPNLNLYSPKLFSRKQKP